MGEGDEPGVVRVLGDVGEDDSGVYVIGVRETIDPGSWSLMFMECYDVEDEQEIALGMDTYCLTVGPGQATYYGGVRECEIVTSELRLRLTDEAAAALSMAGYTAFELSVPTHQIDMLRRGLKRVLTSGRHDQVPHVLPADAVH